MSGIAFMAKWSTSLVIWIRGKHLQPHLPRWNMLLPGYEDQTVGLGLEVG